MIKVTIGEQVWIALIDLNDVQELQRAFAVRTVIQLTVV
jgi:hypothetical protein